MNCRDLQNLFANSLVTTATKKLPLGLVSKGSDLRVVDIPQGVEGTRLIRLGVLKGAFIECVERLPGGTVVIEINRQEIAIGASLAKRIFVESAADGQSPGAKGKHA
jgi:Fe2+ transport system protein FeoA